MAPKFLNFAATKSPNPLQIHHNLATIRRTQTLSSNKPNRLSVSHNNTNPSTMGSENKKKNYWLLKTEPSEWSWSDQAANNGVSKWDGVKNKQAQNNLKSMSLGDLCFFYHSGPRSRRVVGVVEVIKEWYLDDEDDENSGAVDVEAVGEMRRSVDLKEMKGDDGLKGFELFRQPRLSVVKVGGAMWERICELGGGIEDGDEEEDEGGD